MSTAIAILRELIGLFVDDGALAIAIVAVVLIAAAFAALAPQTPLLAGAILLFGCLGVLLVNIAAAAR